MSPGEALERNEKHVIHTSQSSLPPCFRHQKPPGPDYLNLARPAARLSGRGDSHTRWRAGRRRSGHVHLLVSLRATHTLADVLRELKSVSSKWAHEEMGVRSFAWQEGYGAFTVSASQSDATGFIRLNALRLKLHAQTRDSEIPPPSASLV